MDRQQLIDAVSEDLFAYVMHGEIAEQQIFDDLKPTGLDERFESFEALVDLHFLLRPEVVDFVEMLPQRLRSIKTQTQNVQTTARGKITGRVDWESTIRRRYSKAPNDRSLFVCDNRHESYDIDENIVLKRLLSIVYTTLDDCEMYLEREYDWVTDRWKENLTLVDRMRDLFERNVHVTRIRDPERYEPTDRMLQRAETARNDVYRDAAGLLRDHRQSRSGNEAAIKDLLETTLITPDDEETLFELYVLFRYIEAVEDYQNGGTSIATIETDRQEVAKIQSDEGADVVLYHDNSAANRDLSFIPEPLEKPDEALTRTEQIQRRARRIVNQYFEDDRFERRTNRPDIIVLEIQHQYQHEYLITEIKHSTKPETIQQGIKETLEYLAFLRHDDTLVFSDSSPFGSGSNGVLVTQDINERETASFDDQETIRIVQASELDELLPNILQNVL